MSTISSKNYGKNERTVLTAPFPPQSMLTSVNCTSIACSTANDEISSQFTTVNSIFNIDFGGKGEFLAMSPDSQDILEMIVD